MSLLDVFMPQESGSPEETEKKEGFFKTIWHKLFSNEKTKENAEAIKENSKKEREGIFSEALESLLNRYFPNASKSMDLIKNMTGKADAESVPWQNEFETITAMTMFCPDFLLKYITGPISRNAIFLKLVEHWPIEGKVFGKKIAEEIQAGKNPDQVVDALRAMHQDITLGKVSLEKFLPTIMRMAI